MNKEELLQFIINIAPAIGAVVGSLLVAVKNANNMKKNTEDVKSQISEVRNVKMGSTYKALKEQNTELIAQNYELMNEIKQLKKILTKGREE